MDGSGKGGGCQNDKPVRARIRYIQPRGTSRRNTRFSCIGFRANGQENLFGALQGGAKRHVCRLCLRLAVSETCVLLSFCFSFLSAWSSCFWLRQKPQAFQSAENFFPFGCKRKIAFSRKNRIYAIHRCIYAVWMYFYSITLFFSGL